MITVHTAKSATKCHCPIRGEGKEPCIASRCMAWRWFGDAPEPRTVPAIPPTARTNNEVTEPAPDGFWIFTPALPAAMNDGDAVPAYWMESVDSTDARRLGFCGLAGQAEN
ncbi:MAG TPA: hypothetical protein PKE37_15260 [Thiomonas arsenitoxydans]|jgi:hypothetical protein|uniref:hypothetical protein n=1 Tax=Thiomonas arsenitoxydans (strain DSM 22701 / CIP 110005 / 3As) TaxID=426114 RepID=UPI002C95F6E1|nr:hypothetical protein [Thiomonas arsenitoxydans]HML83115.1 hypothetical protein [Thiomonas arsenitoxydans]